MDFKLRDVAVAFGISDRYVRQVFALSHETPSAFIRRRRTERAAAMLRDPRNDSMTILTIAFDCGFASPDQMRSAFQRRLGVTPLRYRDRFRAA